MLKKIITISLLLFVNSMASNFLSYNRSLSITPSINAIRSDWGTLGLGLSYGQKIGKSILEFNITPKVGFYSDGYEVFSGNSTIQGNDSIYSTPYSYYYKSTNITIEASVLFSHRTAMITRELPWALTFNLWKYGICYEGFIFGKTEYEINGVKSETKFDNYDNRFNLIGFIYKPFFGFQVNKNFNIAFELTYSINHQVSDQIGWFPKYGGGVSFTFSDPVSQF